MLTDFLVPFQLYSHRCNEWPCQICNVVFQTKSGRSKHLRKHNLAVEISVMEEEEAEIDEENDEYEQYVFM